MQQVGRWFSPSTPVSSTNKTDRRYITEILLQVALNKITPDVYNKVKHKTQINRMCGIMD
jgi:hypothetical protein